MYKQNKMSTTTLKVNASTEGETIEQKMERVVNNNESIKDGAPIIYTERKDGVLPGYDIRTDRFEIAIDAMDKVSKTHTAKRDERIKKTIEDLNKKEGKNSSTEQNNGEPKSTQG